MDGINGNLRRRCHFDVVQQSPHPNQDRVQSGALSAPPHYLARRRAPAAGRRLQHYGGSGGSAEGPGTWNGRAGTGTRGVGSGTGTGSGPQSSSWWPHPAGTIYLSLIGSIYVLLPTLCLALLLLLFYSLTLLRFSYRLLPVDTKFYVVLCALELTCGLLLSQFDFCNVFTIC